MEDPHTLEGTYRCNGESQRMIRVGPANTKQRGIWIPKEDVDEASEVRTMSDEGTLVLSAFWANTNARSVALIESWWRKSEEKEAQRGQ